MVRSQLRIRKNEKSNSYYYSLLSEVKVDGMESCMMLEAL